MNRSTLVFFFALIVSMVSATASPSAAAQAAQGKRIAFIVGNAKYANESPLANPHNDARLLAATLKNDLRFDEVIVQQDLGRAQLYDLVTDINRKAKGADAVVVYYSGHGMKGPGGNYLIPVDARISDEDHIRRDAVPASDIVDALQNSNARVALLVLDACRDSPYAKRTKSASKGLTRMNITGGNVLVAYATSVGTTADDGASGQGNSPYAKALSDALKQTQQSVLAQLDNVRRSVRQATGNKQNPTREGDLEINVYLVNPTITVNNNVSVPAPAPVTRTDPDEEAYKAAVAADVVEGYEQYLKDFSNGRNASAAKIKLAALKKRAAATVVVSLAAPPLAAPPLAASPNAPATIFPTSGYSKISNSGDPLPNSATLGSEPNDWACTRDNASGLTWEVKTVSGLRSMKHSYRWTPSIAADRSPQTTPLPSGGSYTLGANTTCEQVGRCDTMRYVADVNESRLCGAGDWKMPSALELKTLMVMVPSKQAPWVDTVFFPNTPATTAGMWFWTGSWYGFSNSLAALFNFDNGNSSGRAPVFDYPVRLVRSGQ